MFVLEKAESKRYWYVPLATSSNPRFRLSQGRSTSRVDERTTPQG